MIWKCARFPRSIKWDRRVVDGGSVVGIIKYESRMWYLLYYTATEQSAAEDTDQVSQDEEYMDMNEYEIVA